MGTRWSILQQILYRLLQVSSIAYIKYILKFILIIRKPLVESGNEESAHPSHELVDLEYADTSSALASQVADPEQGVVNTGAEPAVETIEEVAAEQAGGEAQIPGQF